MTPEIEQIEKQIVELKERLSAARRKAPPERISEYTLRRLDGTAVRLSELFGDKTDLLLVHNMGRSCPYCTLWADGFQSLSEHLQSRAAVVIATPDEPEVARAFATGRGWRLPVVSTAGSSLTRDLGYEPEPKKYWPGVSALKKEPDGSITRRGKATFGPGDDFCSLWHLFDLLDGGAGNWEPRYVYKAT